AAGLEAGRRCVYVEDGTGELDTKCSTAGVVGAGLVAVALPALGSALAVRWGGATDISVGRLVPALIGATMAVLPGYGFTLTTVGGGVGETKAVGFAILLVGTPLLTTAADRLYRTLRAR
ncbi:MAG: hypothetical protein Q8N53_19575, partial [Longimicrobiales bacterium]|nr:hypothetical protein [Longimicrobiales bacterium]